MIETEELREQEAPQEATENDDGGRRNKKNILKNKVAEENKKLHEELSESKEKYLRLFSEYDNYRKRTAKEKIDIIATASESVMLKLLPILDDIDRSINAFETATDIEAVKQGSLLIFDKFYSTLKNLGIKEIDTTGEDFDPDIHEAIANFPVSNEEGKNKVVDTVEKAYSLNGKVIRHAKVVVGN